MDCRKSNDKYKKILLEACNTVKKQEQLKWQEFADHLNKTLDESYSESKYRKDLKSILDEENYTEDDLDDLVKSYSDYYEEPDSMYEEPVFDSYIAELETLQEKTDKLNKERKKRAIINREYNKGIRSVAETEMFYEMFADSLQQCSFPVIPQYGTTPLSGNGLKAVLVISDSHYGKTFTIKGVRGEIINSYSPEIYKERMCDLLHCVVRDIEIMGVSHLEVIDNGDCIDGILRTGSSLQKLQVGVTDSVIEYSAHMVSWLTEMFNRTGVSVNYSITGGNHDLLRLLSSKKDFDDENVCKLIHCIINDRLTAYSLQYQIQHGISPNLTVSPYDECIYKDIDGFKILAYHGEDKLLSKGLSFFENMYGITIDMIIGGHFHSKLEETLGVGAYGDKQVIRVLSLCGMDDYAKSIRKYSKAGAKFMIFNQGYQEWERTYYLN